MPQSARYDGYADWYEDWNQPHAERYGAEVQELLGPGDGLCLDLGCGGGHYLGTVAAIWISTDVDDFGAVVAEAARVLRPGGLLGCYLAHPCFNGPHIEWLDDGGVRAHPTYRQAGWQAPAPWWGPHVRARVGMRLFPLADLLNALARNGLIIEHAAEAGHRGVPTILALRARKAG